jgi:hypothetical protein
VRLDWSGGTSSARADRPRLWTRITAAPPSSPAKQPKQPDWQWPTWFVRTRPFDREGHNEGLHQEAPEIDAPPEVPHFGGVSDGEGGSGVLQDSADSTTGGALPALWALSNMRPQRTAVGWRMQEGGGQVIAAQRLEALRKSLDDAWNHSTELEDQIADGAAVELDRASVREIRGFVVAALGRVRR